MFPHALDELIKALRQLPGVGEKSALRMALYLLERNQAGAKRISAAIDDALVTIRKCESCRNLTDRVRCQYCEDESRDAGLLCIVENPADVFALSKSIDYRGYYFVLYGRLSPLDGIGPTELGLDRLEQRLQSGQIRELILATNSTVEGEATAYYIDEMAKPYDIQVTKIAHGIPMGGELEYLDGGTLAHAFEARQKL